MTSVTSVFDPVDEPNGRVAHFMDQSVFKSLWVRDFRVCGVCVFVCVLCVINRLYHTIGINDF